MKKGLLFGILGALGLGAYAATSAAKSASTAGKTFTLTFKAPAAPPADEETLNDIAKQLHIAPGDIQNMMLTNPAPGIVNVTAFFAKDVDMPKAGSIAVVHGVPMQLQSVIQAPT